MKLRSDRGAGSILGVTILGGVLAAMALLLPLYIGMSLRQSVVGAADSAALAAADVAVGILPGYPCEVAAVVASANRTTLARCDVDGLIVTVSTKRQFLGQTLRATATAGPPRSGLN